MNKTNAKIKIGISSCLLGNKVRFDANHKEHRYITRELGKRFDFIPVCPEMAVGLGVPRTPIHLIGDEQTQRAVNIKNEAIDVTQSLVDFGRSKGRELTEISGYIFKKGSPSCGLYGVKIYKTPDRVIYSGIGVYAKQIIEANPLLPVEEEGRLNDMLLRANFLQRVEIYHDWQQLIANGLTRKSLINFHTQHKFLVLAHCEITYRNIGKLVGEIGNSSLEQAANQYIEMLMTGLQKPTTRGKHTNVLQHLLGYFKNYLDKHDKTEMSKLLEDYRNGQLPRVVVVTMLKHYLRKFPSNYVQQQSYLNFCYSDI